MPLKIHLHTDTSIPIEVDSLKLELLREQSPSAISKTLVSYGNQKIECGEFFNISGSASDDNTVVWEGNLRNIKFIGASLNGGSIRVDGAAGMHLGARMESGEISVNGDVQDWAGAEMRGGTIRVHGNAGNNLGAAYRGSRRGMRGGEILVEGSAGNELGHTMRRGLIAVRGKVGDAAGVGMVAGSIFIFGESGRHHGAGMKRGTIAFFQNGFTPRLLPTFLRSSVYKPVFLRLSFRYLNSLGFSVPEDCLHASYQRYCGDLLELGKGEILTRAD